MTLELLICDNNTWSKPTVEENQSTFLTHKSETTLIGYPDETNYTTITFALYNGGSPVEIVGCDC